MVQDSHGILSKPINYGIRSDDTAEVRIVKQVLNIFASITTLAGFIWGIIYWVNDEQLVALLPWTYTVVGLSLAMIYYRNEAAYRQVLTGFKVMIVLMPLAMSLSFGDFFESSGVIIWAFSAPLIALITDGKRDARRWFVIFVVVVLIDTLVPPLRTSQNLPYTVIVLFFSINIFGMSIASYSFLEFAVKERDRARLLFETEKRKSDQLLRNVLPEAVIPHLHEGDNIYVEEFEEVSVMFADIVDFTSLTGRLPPRDMLDLLNEIYSYFDSLLLDHSAEKIRTVGDNYMVIVGAPVPEKDHAFLLVTMAQKMIDYLQNEKFINLGVSIRIGINSGPVVAGVIGKDRFHFDIWGDIVNLASRFESHGLPGRIQIGSPTFGQVEGRINCDHRGKIDIKGKGMIETWLVSDTSP